MKVTLVPTPGFDETKSLSAKLSIMEKPMPHLSSSGAVVKSGMRAFFTSSIPHPRSEMTRFSVLSL